MARATIIDVARATGVSAQTVSRVVNNRPGMSEATRLRVQEAVERLGYRPDSIARGLVTRRTLTLGLVVPDIANPFFPEIVQGAEEVAWEAGYNLFLCDVREDLTREAAALRSLHDKRVDGVIVCSPRLQDEVLWPLLKTHPAAVVVNRRAPGEVASSVRVDYAAGVRQAVRHLHARGCRTLGFLAGPAHAYGGLERARGFAEALAAAGQERDPALSLPCPPYVEGGYEAARSLLQNHREVDGLFCYNDLVALGALRACAESGRRVPEDVSIIGCDDIPLAALVTPALSTLGMSKRELGAQAVRLLLGRIEGHPKTGEPETGETVLEPELIVRASAP